MRNSPRRHRSWRMQAGLAALAFAAAAPTPAKAWWRGGVYFGIAPAPYYYGPPVVYPPIAYPPLAYAAPPVIYAPPGTYPGSPPLAGQACYAGAYVCPLQQ